MSRHPLYDPSKHSITLLEASKIAGGASGKAGGLLALWAYPREIVPLSYKLHAELAAEHGGEKRWGFRKVHCGSVEAKGRMFTPLGKVEDKDTRGGNSSPLPKRDKAALGLLAAKGIPKDLDWVTGESVKNYSEMGTPETTAQVHPYQFTTSMAQLAEEKGVKIILGSVTNIEKTDGSVKSVTYKDKMTSEQHTIPASDVVLAVGPWTKSLYPSAPITSTRAHSVTIKSKSPISSYALFTEISLPPNFGRTDQSVKSKRVHAKTVTPEIYARPGDEAYCCGEGDTMVPLPQTSADVVTDESRCQDIIDYVSSISDELRDGEVTVRQACYLPSNQGGNGHPLIGTTRIVGLWMAAGHTCWGIQNGPATGKLISEFVFDGEARSAKISTLDPRNVL